MSSFHAKTIVQEKETVLIMLVFANKTTTETIARSKIALTIALAKEPVTLKTELALVMKIIMETSAKITIAQAGANSEIALTNNAIAILAIRVLTVQN